MTTNLYLMRGISPLYLHDLISAAVRKYGLSCSKRTASCNCVTEPDHLVLHTFPKLHFLGNL